MNRSSVPLDATTCHRLEGIYVIDAGREFFGETAALKWTYTVETSGTVYHLSFFCKKDGAYIVCEGKESKGDVLLKGYWRKLATADTGTVKLMITSADGANELLNTPTGTIIKPLTIRGAYGFKRRKAKQPLSFHYQQPIPEKPSFEIIAHRGGARNIDFLPVSENTLDMIRMAARLGATGIEVDVRMTKDGVPILMHDSFLSLHTVRNVFYKGMVSSYTLAQLKRVKLKKGGRIPTLEDALHAAVHFTPLRMVWLDIKRECDLRLVRELQLKYLKIAAEIGREINIYIGIPDRDIMNCFTSLEDHKQLPSLCELNPQDALGIDAKVWAPQYTGGVQAEEVAKIHAAGKKAYVWSLDHPWMINQYLKGGFDGIVTNSPPVVFHCYYVNGLAPVSGTASESSKSTPVPSATSGNKAS